MVIKSKGYNDFINVTLVCDDDMVKAHKVLKTSKKKLILLLNFSHYLTFSWVTWVNFLTCSGYCISFPFEERRLCI